MTVELVDDATAMAKGQATIPTSVREAMGISVGDRVTFVVNGTDVRVVNTAVYAMRILQDGMAGAAVEAGIGGEQDVVDLVKSVRGE